MVNDLSEYFSQKQRIESLEKEIVQLEKEVAQLTRRNVEYKHICEKLREKLDKKKPLTRGQKAIITIKQLKRDGFEGKTIDQICKVAKRTSLSINYVTDLWYKH